MYECDLNFPIGESDNLKEMIDLFVDIGGDEIGLKMLLFIAVNQKGISLEIIDMLAEMLIKRYGYNIITKSKFAYGSTLLHRTCDSSNPSIDITRIHWRYVTIRTD